MKTPAEDRLDVFRPIKLLPKMKMVRKVTRPFLWVACRIAVILTLKKLSDLCYNTSTADA